MCIYYALSNCTMSTKSVSGILFTSKLHVSDITIAINTLNDNTLNIFSPTSSKYTDVDSNSRERKTNF